MIKKIIITLIVILTLSKTIHSQAEDWNYIQYTLAGTTIYYLLQDTTKHHTDNKLLGEIIIPLALTITWGFAEQEINSLNKNEPFDFGRAISPGIGGSVACWWHYRANF